MALGSPVLGFFPVFLAAWGGGPLAFFVALPFGWMTGKGISLTGARKFKTDNKWHLQISDE